MKKGKKPNKKQTSFKINESRNRREFLIKTGKSIGFCLFTLGSINLLTECENFIEKSDPHNSTTIEIDINLQEYKILKKIGYGLMTKFPKVNYGIPVIIVKIADNQYACYSSMCTHAHCYGDSVRPSLGTSPGFKDIVCSCHGSRFDPFNNANVIQGPAEKPLKQYSTSFNPDTNILKIYF